MPTGVNARILGAAVVLFLSTALHAATLELRVLLDHDADGATGCAVSGMPGVDQVLVTQVGWDGSTATVTRIARQLCAGTTLGPEIDVDATAWPAAFEAASEHLTVETRMSHAAFAGAELPAKMRVGVEARRGSSIHRALVRANGSPAIYPPSPGARRRSAGVPGAPRTITLDGNTGDWQGLAPLFDGIAATGTPSMRLLRVLAFSSAAQHALYFRFDASLSDDNPFALDDDYERTHGQGLSVPAPGVLANDGDPDGEPLVANAVSTPSHGTVVLHPDGSFTYTPSNPASMETDAFDYRASDGTHDSNAARVTIRVSEPPNSAPVAANDGYTANEDTPLGIAAPGVLANDGDADGDALVATLLAPPQHGAVTLNPDGGFTYTPAANFHGADSFSYTAHDGTAASGPATASITVTAVNDAPAFTSPAAVSVPENTTAIAAVAAADVDGDALTYAITGGADQAAFAIAAASGALTFTAARNFELPSDANADNVYVMQVTASDGALSAVHTLAVTVTNVDEAPAITSAAAFSVPENITAVASLTASDPEGGAIAWSITGGADAADFAIGGSTGQLSFAAPPNFEAPADADTNNVYLVQVSASDGANATNQAIAVTVTNVNEPLVFTSPAAVSVAENTTAILTVAATDPDGPAVSYAITGGDDQVHFVLNGANGLLTWAAARNFEIPVDANANNVYLVQITATAGASTAVQNLSVTVTDVNEPPSIASAAAFSVPENTGSIVFVAASDPEGAPIAYSISGGADAGDLAIDGSTGELAFVPPPNFEVPADADSNNVYVVQVSASDGTNATNQTITLTVTNVDEPLSFTSSSSASVPENTTAILTVAASDPDGPAATYAITGGDDQVHFVLNGATGVLTWAAARNFEIPVDADANNIYLVQITATAGASSAVQNLSVTVTNVNEPPSITSAAAFSVPENTGSVVFVAASDPEGAAIAWSITGGADAGDFTIGSASGELSFVPPPNFEAPADADSNNVYLVQVTASDGTNSTNQTFTLTVTNVDEPLTFTSPAAVSVAENTTAILTVAATDPDGPAVSYAITGGADQVHFSIHPGTGALTFVAAKDFETPIDANNDNIYLVQVTATAGASTALQNLSVTVTNVNEPPAITTAGSFSVPENTGSIVFVTASDPEGAAIAWSITGSADAGDFTIGNATGELSFVPPPNFEAPADADNNNVYLVQVTASDGSNSTSQTFTLTVTNVDEPPAFTSSAAVNVAEDTTAVVDVDAVDPEGATQTYAITGGTDQSSFTIDGTSGVLNFVSPPDFESPADANTDNVYIVQVTASDSSPATQTVSVTVTNTDEPPFFTSSNSVSVPENTTAITTVTATDPEGAAVTFTVSPNVDGPKVSIHPATGVLTFNAPQDYENATGAGGGILYIVNVVATAGSLSATQTVLISLTNADEAPAFTSSAMASVPENTTAVIDVDAVDPEGATPSYSITGGADQALFTIDGTTGMLSFVSGRDFENPTDADANNAYVVQVTASDAVPATQTITVTVTDGDDPPLFVSSATPSVPENATAVLTVQASDPELAAVTYSITGGADASGFSIGGATGALTFNAPPNFEAPHDADTNNIYLVEVTATDGMNPAVQSLTVTVTNVNEPPSITSAGTFNVAENSTSVTTVTSSDPDLDSIAYSITGGADQAAFSIHPTSGALAFVAAPNFESPTDAGSNNTYVVQVTAADGTNPVNQTITVTVTDVNEAPFFTSSATVSVPENTSIAIDVNATDPEAAAVTYSINGGADAADFSIDPSTGVLSFVVSPNFEAPHDANTDNVYVVQVGATDGSNPATQNLTITVTNVNEVPTNTVPGSQNTSEDTNLVFPGTISIADPDAGSSPVQVSLSATSGTISTNGTAGLTFTPANASNDGVDDTTLVFTGTIADINARLNGLTFKPSANYYGNGASVVITTNDQGNTGSGGAQQDGPDVVTINVTPVNDKPTTPSYTVANGNAHVTHSGIGITINSSDSNELKEDSADVDTHDPYSELTVQIVGGSLSPANATLTLLDASTGAFYFEPPGGLSGSGVASFQYRVCDDGDAGLGLAAQCSDPATVQFSITGADTWFVDDAAGCGASCNGSRSKPLVGLNNAALAARGTGDRIFAFSGTYNHGFTMAANESLIGQASTGVFDTLFGVIVPSNGTLDTRPALSGAAVTLQNTLTAAEGTLLRGFSIASGANKGYVASGATTLTVLDSSVNSTGNMAIDVTGATNSATSVAFTTTTSGGGTRGVSLNGVNGTWSLGGGGLTNNTQASFYLQDSNASTITFSGNLNPSGTGRAVLIGTADGNSGANASNGLEAGTSVTLSGNINGGGVAAYESSGGTLNLTGNNHTWNTTTIRGVDLIDNNGATFNFSSGNMSITTSTGTGFHASQGGTVNVTGTGNTISTTSGNAFEAIGTASEHMGGGYAFRSISSTNGTKGISVQYHDGAFSVSGDGNDANTTPDNVTAGGTITGADQRGAEFIDVDGPVSLGGMTITNPADTAGPDATVAAGTCGNIPSGGSNTGCFAGIHLDTVSTVSLHTVNVTGSGQIGINGNAVAGLTINTVNVTNSGNTPGEDGMRLYNLSGAGSITSLTVTGSFGKGMLIENTNVSLATSGSPYLVTNSNFQNSSNAQGATLATDLGGTMHVKFVNGTISGNFSNGIQTAGLGSGTLGIYVDNTNFSDNTSAIVIQASGGSTVFDVRNADHIGRAANSSYGMGVKADGTGTATGVFFGNILGNGTAASGGCSGCNGINVDARNSGSITVEIRGNTIRNVGSSGIQLRDGEGSAKVNAIVTGNLIKDPDGGGSFAGIFGDSGVLSNDSNCLTAQIGGTTAYPGAPTATAGEIQNRIEGAWGTSGIRVLKRFGGGAPPEPVFNLPGYDGSGVVTWIQTRNSFSGVATPVTQNTGSGGAFTGAAGCP